MVIHIVNANNRPIYNNLLNYKIFYEQVKKIKE